MPDSKILEEGTIRRTFLALLALALAGVLFALWPSPAAADMTFTVNRTDNAIDRKSGDGKCDTSRKRGKQCNLLSAILTANETPGHDTINFKIGGTAPVKTIRPDDSLPAIVDPVTINGYSQGSATTTKSDDAKPNTLAEGNNAVIKIELDGTNAGSWQIDQTYGLKIAGPNTTIKGLAINRFDGYGILVEGSLAANNKIEGNFIGTNASGTQDLGNSLAGVHVKGAPNNTVGGTTPAARNVISGSTRDGVFIEGTAATNNKVEGSYIGTDASGTQDLGNDGGVEIFLGPNNTIGGTVSGAGNLISGNNTGVLIVGSLATGNMVQGNYIGTEADGTGALGNSFEGVLISSNTRVEGNTIHANGAAGVRIEGSGNTVGGATPAEGNSIFSNGDDGVSVRSGTGNSVLSNSIYQNAGSGIDLYNFNGLTPNDTGDPDTGANNLQNFPVITSATRDSTTGTTTISGTLNSNPSQAYTIQCFETDGAAATSYGEGQRLLDTTTTATNADGDSPTFTCAGTGLAVGDTVSATATNTSGTATNTRIGDTSEFSQNLVVTSSS